VISEAATGSIGVRKGGLGGNTASRAANGLAGFPSEA